MGWLDGDVALVTGGGSGIGRSVVDTFVAEGARVGVLDRSAAAMQDLRQAHGDLVATVQADATAPGANEDAVAATIRSFGRLDTLVCCVGLFDHYRSLLDLPGERLVAAFHEIFAVNVMSYMLAAKAAAGELARSQGSVILTLSSASFYPDGAGVLYGATKWACRGLVMQLARELAPAVRVNGVAPGGTGRTGLAGVEALGRHPTAAEVEGRDERIAAASPLGVLAVPEDHAWAYVYLASRSRARVVSGAVINSDGGRAAAVPGEAGG
ncbi:MAG: SDR family NAD(P)-dependent oxidoreductase [Acidimicrobiales bacterium]